MAHLEKVSWDAHPKWNWKYFSKVTELLYIFSKVMMIEVSAPMPALQTLLLLKIFFCTFISLLLFYKNQKLVLVLVLVHSHIIGKRNIFLNSSERVFISFHFMQLKTRMCRANQKQSIRIPLNHIVNGSDFLYITWKHLRKESDLNHLQ